jgi:hypothetical protein
MSELTASVQVLGLSHELQGPKFYGFVDDPSYRLLLSKKIMGFDMVFEEASGQSPSIAEDIAKELLGVGHYIDVDPPREERSRHGIPEETIRSEPIDHLESPDSFVHMITEAQTKREELWVRRIRERHFSTALMICGIGHSLSLTVRLASAAFLVSDPWAYLPPYKLNPSGTAQVAGKVIDFMSLEAPTNDPQERRSRGDHLIKELDNILSGRLSRAATDSWLRLDLEGPFDPVQTDHVVSELDEVFIEQAESLGWRMLESNIVIQRIAYWMDKDPRGIEKLEKFNKSLECNAKIGRGSRQHSFREQEWFQTRKDALREVKALQRKMVSQFAAKNRIPSPSEAYSAIRAEIAASPSAYAYLTANLRSFSEYVGPLTPSFVTGQITPGAVLDGWFDYQGSTAAGKSRQIISRIGSRRKR